MIQFQIYFLETKKQRNLLILKEQKYQLQNTKEKTSPKKEEKVTSYTKLKAQRLSYKDQRLYEILPKEIEELENNIKKIEQDLSNPNLYSENKEKFFELTEKLEQLKQQKDGKETKWLEIEEYKNSL